MCPIGPGGYDPRSKTTIFFESCHQSDVYVILFADQSDWNSEVSCSSKMWSLLGILGLNVRPFAKFVCFHGLEDKYEDLSSIPHTLTQDLV